MRTPSVILTLMVAMVVASGASAQTIIDMPPPPAPAPAAVILSETEAPMAADSSQALSAAPSITSSKTQAPSVGDVALARYARARSGKYNTYFNDASYWNNGVRVYTYPKYYPQFVWGPFWGGSWPWGCW
jgi:hypothetical protein